VGASSKKTVRFRVASDQSLLVYFGLHEKKSSAEPSSAQNQITIESNYQVRKLLWLMESEPIAGVRNLHPAYASICIKFDARELRHSDLEKILRGYIARMNNAQLPPSRVLEIPVCYGGDFGPDLNEVAELHGMTPDAAIEAHSSQTYLVYFLGFAPGFAYLGDLPEALVTPRLPTPRRSVPAGSVGIAGRQTGVYPISTPGGWRLLGRTPAAMFHPDRPQMSLLSIGDRVRFVPISRAQFSKLEHA
jgi:inhibitor of KinA